MENIVKACKETGVENILFASSSEVYGEGKIGTYLKETTILKPKSPYGLAKMKAEQLLKKFAEENKIKITILRYCNIFGPGQRNEFVLPIFINNIIHDVPINVCGKGDQIRSFTFVKDAVDGTIRALFRITGGNPPHFNGEMKARFLKETLPCVVYYWTINNIQNRHIMVHYMYK